jgi:ribosomal protein S18 acetylase RimI-like enzyme
MSFVATQNGKVVGAVLCGHDGRRGYLHHLAVHPDSRRRGIGRQLADRCLQALKKAGIQKCHLFSLSGNADGDQFWRAVGWHFRSDLDLFSMEIDH